MNEEPAQILKVDVSGRVWTPRERRQAVLDEWERSEMPATKFAEHIGMKYPTLASWVQKRRRLRAGADGAGAPGTQERGAGALQWVEAVSGAAGGVLCVQLPGGARMEVADRAQAVLAAELVRALAENKGPARC